jgi:assimilatory nitrate reductase catalytic subunit
VKGSFMRSIPRFLQGIVDFEGLGLDKPYLLEESLRYTVPAGVTTQPLYFRGGNSTEELICIELRRNGVPMRLFPIGAKADVHVPLRVVEDMEGGTLLELYIAAPAGLSGAVVIDFGMVEV